VFEHSDPKMPSFSKFKNVYQEQTIFFSRKEQLPHKEGDVEPYDIQYAVFSNYAKCYFSCWSSDFKSAEHAFHWAKHSGNQDVQTKILEAKNPAAAKKLGIRNRLTPSQLSMWDSTKEDRMKTILKHKFGQNPKMLKILLSTEDRTLVECSPWDSTWGCGSNGHGRNILGKCLMHVRSYYQKDQAE
jgi:hypothetical protein